jgi:type IV pilus assembly protein PilB
VEPTHAQSDSTTKLKGLRPMGSTDTERYLPRLDHSYFDAETRPHLGAVLLRSKLLRPEQLDEALAKQAETGKRLGEVLIEDGLLFPQDIARALATQFGFDYVDIQHVSVDPRAAACLDPELGQRLSAIPVRFHDAGTKVVVAVADPTSEGLAEVQAAIGRPVVFAVTESADIRHAWRTLLQGYKP